MLRLVVRIFFLAFSYSGFAPDEHLSSKQQDDWGLSMSFSTKSDVKNHLSTRKGKHLIPFKPMSPADASIYAKNKAHEAQGVISSSVSASEEIPSSPSISKAPNSHQVILGILVDISTARKPGK